MSKQAFAQDYHMTVRCYGMSGPVRTPFTQPLKGIRNDAARVRVLKGVMLMSRIWFGVVFAGAMMSLSAAADAQDRVPLPQEAHINEQLIAGAEGDLIRNNCPSISARMLVVFGKLYDLKAYAESKGYTEAEVKAFLKDKDQKARVKGAAAAYLASQGAVAGDSESYCRVGRAEIANGTLLGSLIRD